MYADSSFLPGVPEDHEVLGAGDIDEENTQKTPEYDTTMYSDVSNIDNNDNNTWRTIYEKIYEYYFGEIKLFPRAFTNLYKTIQINHKTK